MNGTVYQLVCPIKKTPIYIGSTIHPLSWRLNGHIRDTQKSKSPVYQYLRSVEATPTIEELEVVEFKNKKELLKAEKRWIRETSNKGIDLLNYGYNVGDVHEISMNADVYNELVSKYPGTKKRRDFISSSVIKMLPIARKYEWWDVISKLKLTNTIFDNNVRAQLDIMVFKKAKRWLDRDGIIDSAFYTDCVIRGLRDGVDSDIDTSSMRLKIKIRRCA